MHTCRRHYPGGAAGARRSCPPAIPAFPETHRSASASVFSRLAQRSLALRPACSPGRPRRPFYTEGFRCFVASTTAPIATGWSDSCQAGIPPAEDLRLVTAHGSHLLFAIIDSWLPAFWRGWLGSGTPCQGEMVVAPVPRAQPFAAAQGGGPGLSLVRPAGAGVGQGRMPRRAGRG